MLELWKTWTLLERLLEQEERMQMLTILTRNHQLLNQKFEIDEFSMTYLNVMHFKSLGRCEVLNESRLESTQVQERRHGPQSITYGTMISRDSDLAFRTATGELVKGGKQVQVAGCDDWGLNRRVRGVSSTGVQTIVVCWEVHNDWSHCVV